MVEGVGKIIKYALFAANLIILIGGISVFAVGVWTLADKAFIERLLGSDLYVSSASILIATGVIVTVISFLGCMGAVKEIKCMLLTRLASLMEKSVNCCPVDVSTFRRIIMPSSASGASEFLVPDAEDGIIIRRKVLTSTGQQFTDFSIKLARRCPRIIKFFIILFMIFITMLVGGILGHVFRNEVDEHMRREMLVSIPLYGNETAVTDAWDAAQTEFKCCGIDEDGQEGYKIWTKNNKFTGTDKVPSSCCKSKEKTEVVKCQESPSEETTYLNSCYDKAKMFVKDHALIVGGIGIGIACLMIVGMVLSCSLFMLID